MINNKTRIISFLMAFLLIFTFAFVNPLAVSKSDAFAPAVVLTTQGAKIITGVLVSAGYIIHEGATATADYDAAVRSIANVVYQTLNGAEKLLLMSLSVIDNIVEVPLSLYNSIVDKVKNILEYEDVPTLLASDIGIRYKNLSSSSTGYPKIVFPYYYINEELNYSQVIAITERVLDLREAQPFLVYRGVDNAESNIWYEEGIEYFFMDNIFPEDVTVYEYENTTNKVFLTPDLSSYSIPNGTGKTKSLNLDADSSYLRLRDETTDSSTGKYYFRMKASEINVNDCLIYMYFISSPQIRDGYTNLKSTGGVCIDIYDKVTGEFIRQYIQPATGGIPNSFDYSTEVTYTTYDVDLAPEITIAPTISNADSSANVLTLPTELSGAIGLTSADVNVGIADVPGTGEGTGTGETTGLLQKILDTLMALGDYILEGIKNIFMPDLDGIILLKEAIEEKFAIIGELKEMIDDLLDILTNNEPEPPNIIIPLSKAEGSIDYGQDCIALDLSWYARYKEVVDLFIIGFAYVFFVWRLYQRLPGIISGADGINWDALSGKSEYSGSGNIGFKPGGGKK